MRSGIEELLKGFKKLVFDTVFWGYNLQFDDFRAVISYIVGAKGY